MLKYTSIIVGSGFIANKFRKYFKLIKSEKLVIYAAGISNSSEINRYNLKKEINKFKKFQASNSKRLIFISTYSVNDVSRLNKTYVQNKIKIENLIRKKVKSYIILRLPEIVGINKNPYTLTNFFHEKISKNKKFYIYKNVKRNILDVDDAIKFCIKIINKNRMYNKEFNLLNKNYYSPLKIVKVFEQLLGRKANFKMKTHKIQKFKFKNNKYLKFNQNYLKKILKKYY